MSDRLCGYCRQPSHNKNKCPMRLDQIEVIRRHVGQQRKLAQEIMIANGIGPGAIVSAYDGWTGEEFPCFVPALEPHDYSLMEWRTVKYKKQVRVSLIELGDIKAEKKHELVHFINKIKISVDVYSIADSSKNLTAHFMLDRLDNPIVHVVRGVYRGWEYNKPSSVLSPSDNKDFNMELVMQPFRIHERLSLNPDSNYVTPIL